MAGVQTRTNKPLGADAFARVRVVARADLAALPRWAKAFEGERKDHRFYELVEDTINPEFDYRYFVVEDPHGEALAIQPFFILDQDLLAGVDHRILRPVAAVRRLWPRMLKLRTLMVGCVAGEGHLDGDAAGPGTVARLLAAGLAKHARQLKAPMIVLKEFPARYRELMGCFLKAGFTRIPSLPMTRLDIGYASFDDYMQRALNSSTRRKLRRKFAASAAAPAIEMSVMGDVAPIAGELFALYLQVYERSKLHFEKLTPAFLAGIGARLPDKARFFVWRQEGRAVAFILAMVQGDELFAEYIGLDYQVALDLHLYHYAVRDLTSWAIANGYKHLRSSGLNYDPKLHMRHRLDPIDLYVRHASPLANAVLKRILPLVEPTRYDPVLKLFPNYAELWG